MAFRFVGSPRNATEGVPRLRRVAALLRSADLTMHRSLGTAVFSGKIGRRFMAEP